jgi:cytochrome d ubiquinol oxidase subunit I
MEGIDIALVDWSRMQFALTAMVHWLFVPLALGLSIIVAIMETIYVRTRNPEWKRITKFWMKLFGINFAMGVATWIIMVFEFGTNWSNYSWFVGDIFGVSLTIAGIMALFLVSGFIGVMFFGWDRVSPKHHLLSTWVVAAGASLSALSIMAANAWMQNPVGMYFNPDTARTELGNLWEVLFSPTAINKFLHTVSSGYVLASMFVIGVGSLFILKKREIFFAKRSMLVSSIFGFIMCVFLIVSGDQSSREVASVQPMKFATMQGMYDGQSNAPLIAIGLMGRPGPDTSRYAERNFAFSIEIPNMLSYLAFLDPRAYVPGIKDLIRGNEDLGIISYFDRIERGKTAINTLKSYKSALNNGDINRASEFKARFSDKAWLNNYFRYFGYGYYDNPRDLIPNVPLAFYSFHLMVLLSALFLFVLFYTFYLTMKNKIEKRRWFLWLAISSVPLTYIAGMAGWVLAEAGRQPWVVQDLMPTIAAVTKIQVSSVMLTFWLFAAALSILIAAEFKIMFAHISKGPKQEEK